MIQPPPPGFLRANECLVVDHDVELAYIVVLHDPRNSRIRWFRTEPNEA